MKKAPPVTMPGKNSGSRKTISSPPRRFILGSARPTSVAHTMQQAATMTPIRRLSSSGGSHLRVSRNSSSYHTLPSGHGMPLNGRSLTDITPSHTMGA